MIYNPYKYAGPLDPDKDHLVCISREDDVNSIIGGIMKGDYWVILGPKQIGKTTLLRQIKKSFSGASHLYFDLEVHEPNERLFYKWMCQKLIDELSDESNLSLNFDEDPTFLFSQFLSNFKPGGGEKKIVLHFDEIDSLPFLEGFLKVWRKVFHDRHYHKNLERYAIITTGGVNLTKLALGPTSPFNVAKKFYMKDFSDSESKTLIQDPMESLGIKLFPNALDRLIGLMNGHPQLLQHVCSLLIDLALSTRKTISMKDVDEQVEVLLVANSSIDTLMRDIEEDKKLRELLKQILAGESKKFFPYKEYAIRSSGAICQDQQICKIRNRLFAEFLKGYLETMTDNSEKIQMKELRGNILDILRVINEFLLEEDKEDAEKMAKMTRLRDQFNQVQLQYNEVLKSTNGDTSREIKAIAVAIEGINRKLDNMSSDQTVIKSILIDIFQESNQKLTQLIMNRLENMEASFVKSAMKWVERMEWQENEAKKISNGVEQLLSDLKKNQNSLPPGVSQEDVKKFSDSLHAKVDVKHRLRVSIPIIPFFLSYQGIIGLESGANLQKIWNGLKSKVNIKNHEDANKK